MFHQPMKLFRYIIFLTLSSFLSGIAGTFVLEKLSIFILFFIDTGDQGNLSFNSNFSEPFRQTLLMCVITGVMYFHLVIELKIKLKK